MLGRDIAKEIRYSLGNNSTFKFLDLYQFWIRHKFKININLTFY